MAKFAEPINAIRDYRDLKVGDELWGVCGVYPPSADDKPSVVAAMPRKFRNHPEFGDHSSQGDEVVFDVRCHWHGEGESMMQFASDANMVPGYSHNDNYEFRSKKDAEAYAAWLRYEWEKRPDLIAEQKWLHDDLMDFSDSIGWDYEYDSAE